MVALDFGVTGGDVSELAEGFRGSKLSSRGFDLFCVPTRTAFSRRISWVYVLKP